MSKRVRREFTYSTNQSGETADYVPSPSRDPKRIEVFQGRVGYVIPYLQKIGLIALERTFSDIAENGDQEELSDAAGLISVVSFGTTYHAQAQMQAHKYMFSRAKLPVLYSAETDQWTTQDELIDTTRGEFETSVKIASAVEELAFEHPDKRMIDRGNLLVGRSLAKIAVAMAVIKEDVASSGLGEIPIHDEARLAAQRAFQRSMSLTDEIGVRPTVAQAADPNSPYMQFLNNNPASVSQPVYSRLVGEVAKAEEENLRSV